MTQNELEKGFCEVCQRIKEKHPEKANYLDMMCNLARQPYYPTAINLAWLLTDYKDCFDVGDYISYIHLLAITLHMATSQG